MPVYILKLWCMKLCSICLMPAWQAAMGVYVYVITPLQIMLHRNPANRTQSRTSHSSPQMP